MQYSAKYTLKDGVIFLDDKQMSQEEVLRDLINSTEQLNRFDKLLTAIPECSEHGACIPHAIEWVEKHKQSELVDAVKLTQAWRAGFSASAEGRNAEVCNLSGEYMDEWCSNNIRNIHMSPLMIQTGIGGAVSLGFAVRGFFWMDNAAWATAFLALAFALVALYNEIKLDHIS